MGIRFVILVGTYPNLPPHEFRELISSIHDSITVIIIIIIIISDALSALTHNTILLLWFI